MGKEYAVLPCNGLDKCAGCVAREVAICLAEMTNSQVICPVFYRVADARYHQLAQEKALLVLDGCSSRCASKLAAEKGLKAAQKINIAQVAKEMGKQLGTSLRLGKEEEELAKQIAEQLAMGQEARSSGVESAFFPETLEYDTYRKDKFLFRIPTNPGFYFNENDAWAYVKGTKARIGVTDFAQKNLSDVVFFTPPAVGAEISQFDEAGSLESSKAVFEVVSPVSGKVIAVNDRMADEPELVNQNPYEQGWIAEIELSDFEEDRELLHGLAGYFPIMKRKVDEFHV